MSLILSGTPEPGISTCPNTVVENVPKSSEDELSELVELVLVLVLDEVEDELLKLDELDETPRLELVDELVVRLDGLDVENELKLDAVEVELLENDELLLLFDIGSSRRF